MNKKLCVITPTGDRLDSIKLAIKMMNEQTVQPDLWVIVDDGEQFFDYNEIKCNYKVIKAEKLNYFSLARNLKIALNNIPNKEIDLVIWEDDDFYPSNYLEFVKNKLTHYNFIGSKNYFCYHVGLRQFQNRKTNQQPLFSFSMTGKALEQFYNFIQGFDEKKTSVDLSFLSHIKRNSKVHYYDNELNSPIHILGINSYRKGITASHNSLKVFLSQSFEKDESCEKMIEKFGNEYSELYKGFYQPLPEFENIYVFSNVQYEESEKIKPNKNDFLVFLNKSFSANYYKDHEYKIQIKRKNKAEYGENRKDMDVFYCFQEGGFVNNMNQDFINDFKKEYDWNYNIERGKIKSMTTGYMVVKYLQKVFPNKKIILVNFGLDVKNSTYRCPWHNWNFENEKLKEFEHINLEK